MDQGDPFLLREVDDALLAEERARTTAASASSPAASSSPPPSLEPTQPPGGNFPLDEVFDGTSYDSYNTYARGQMLVYSSDIAWNTMLSELKEDKTKRKGEKDEPDFSFMLTNKNKVNTFRDRFGL